MIDIKHLSITFDRVIFDDASITLSNNSITTIKGKSGTGKTTLLNQLGLVAPLSCNYLMEVILLMTLLLQGKKRLVMYIKKVHYSTT